MVMRPSKPGEPDVCERCHKKGIKFGAENGMDPGDVPDYLPALTEAEQALIALAHQHIQVHRCTGGGTKYRGHVCFFPQQVRKLADSNTLFRTYLGEALVAVSDCWIRITTTRNTVACSLHSAALDLGPEERESGVTLAQIGEWLRKVPLTGGELDILLVRKEGENGYSKDFRVRRSVLRQWIQFKIQNDPDWADVEIDEGALATMPEDGNIGDRLPSVPDGEEAIPAVGVPGTGLHEQPPATAAQGDSHVEATDDLVTPRDSGTFSLDPVAHEDNAVKATLARARAGVTEDDPANPTEAVRTQVLGQVFLQAHRVLMTTRRNYCVDRIVR